MSNIDYQKLLASTRALDDMHYPLSAAQLLEDQGRYFLSFFTEKAADTAMYELNRAAKGYIPAADKSEITCFENGNDGFGFEILPELKEGLIIGKFIRKNQIRNLARVDDVFNGESDEVAQQDVPPAVDTPAIAETRHVRPPAIPPSQQKKPEVIRKPVQDANNALFGQLYDKLFDLPVAGSADEIAEFVLNGQVTVLSAETGSGKTLYVTAKLAEHWQKRQRENEQKTIVVLVPKRFLAKNAAKTIAELSGTRLGGPVGYAIGRRPDDESCFSGETRLLFTTYGYALSSKLLDKASVIVLDEVHERDLDTATARALLRSRLEWGEDVKILEMSATIDAEKQAAYWQDVAPTKVFNVEGNTYPCERRQRPAGSEVANVMELLQEGRKGILVFRPGIADIRETTQLLTEARDEKLRQIERTVTEQMRQASQPRNDREIADAVRRAQESSGLLGLEIEQIYSDMPPYDQRRALLPPSGGNAKVLIGTNIIESGANIAWVDAGVSCGNGKQKHVDHHGAHSLGLEVLPKWRLVQQEGRVKRFKPGVFVLASDIGWDDRPLETKSELERLPLTDVLMQVVRRSLDPQRLTFDPPLDQRRFQQAKRELMRLGLVDEQFKPTEAGKFASTMPLTAEAAATLWHAKQLGILKAGAPLAALIINGGIRLDYRRSHGMDESSDQMDSLKAFLATAQSPDPGTMERLNVNPQKFLSTYALFEGLAKTINRMPDCDSQQDQATETQIRQCILAGKLNQLFRIEGRSLVSPQHENKFNIGEYSSVNSVQDKDYAVAQLFIAQPDKERPMTFAGDVTIVSRHDLLELAKIRPNILEISKQAIIRKASSGERVIKLEFKLHGDDVPFDTIYSKEGQRTSATRQ